MRVSGWVTECRVWGVRLWACECDCVCVWICVRMDMCVLWCMRVYVRDDHKRLEEGTRAYFSSV